MRYLYLIMITLLLGINPTTAQRFGLGFELGTTFSQIDGDFKTGYDKTGLQGGLRGVINIDKKSRFNLQIGLLFSQRGTRIEPEFFQVNPKKTNILHLNYAEIPFLFHLNLHEPDKGFFLEAGFSYNRLVDFSIDEILDDRPTNSFEDLSNDFIKDELHLITALGHYINAEFSILFRYNMALTNLYTLDAEQVFQGGNQAVIESVIGRKYPYLKNYELSLNLIYTIASKQARKKRLRQKQKKHKRK